MRLAAKTSYTIQEMLATIRELGEKPENAKHQPILKEMAWILKDHVQLIARLKSEVPHLFGKDKDRPTARDRLMDVGPNT